MLNSRYLEGDAKLAIITIILIIKKSLKMNNVNIATIILITLVPMILGGCQDNYAEKKDFKEASQVASSKDTIFSLEPFDAFYKRFTNDSIFQIQRIKFPLPGINTDGMDVSDTIYYWQKGKWRMFKGIPSDIDTINFEVKKIRSDTIAINEVSQKHVSFSSKYIFKPKEGRWYLVYYEDINL
ncbi:hypothetical protein GCM10011375_31290 [Hymenobacter qilianensis]|uniref:DUF4348 domain-containing protein n=2 Tax=Hymenobacter qilianensis TaxID=1385715 RepID=A0A7H0GTE7_9BACT|nr:DUF4348 domain-containing protein [Hymenobacter qilianensis]QNP51563.1 DUF4348 domain-containing protein [Hymenobacter qilianensis]GGF73912.1 hypothetical protein GCM10011375_31290 [Hymenobacter qilianensis]